MIATLYLFLFCSNYFMFSPKACFWIIMTSRMQWSLQNIFIFRSEVQSPVRATDDQPTKPGKQKKGKKYDPPPSSQRHVSFAGEETVYQGTVQYIEALQALPFLLSVLPMGCDNCRTTSKLLYCTRLFSLSTLPDSVPYSIYLIQVTNSLVSVKVILNYSALDICKPVSVTLI